MVSLLFALVGLGFSIKWFTEVDNSDILNKLFYFYAAVAYIVLTGVSLHWLIF